MPWKKGESGNPQGRSKAVREVIDAAREHTAAAIDTLAKIARSGKSEPARVSAAVAILDRGWGKPAQTVNTNVRRTLSSVTDEELAAIATGSGEGVAVAADGAGEPDSLH